MTDIETYAHGVVVDYLDDGIDFCRVYEDERIPEAMADHFEEIHDTARKMLDTILQRFLDDC